jgi:hypothetical protein
MILKMEIINKFVILRRAVDTLFRKDFPPTLEVTISLC